MTIRSQHRFPTMNVTGCLQKGVEPGGFTLTAEDGKLRELSGAKATLANHVGHKVTVTGKAVHETKLHEAKMESTRRRKPRERSTAT